MDKEAKDLASQIARQLYAMAAKKRGTDIVDAMHNERYQRTFTDEYMFRKKSRGRASVPAEAREIWKRYHDHTK